MTTSSVGVSGRIAIVHPGLHAGSPSAYQRSRAPHRAAAVPPGASEHETPHYRCCAGASRASTALVIGAARSAPRAACPQARLAPSSRAYRCQVVQRGVEHAARRSCGGRWRTRTAALRKIRDGESAVYRRDVNPSGQRTRWRNGPWLHRTRAPLAPDDPGRCVTRRSLRASGLLLLPARWPRTSGPWYVKPRALLSPSSTRAAPPCRWHRRSCSSSWWPARDRPDPLRELRRHGQAAGRVAQPTARERNALDVGARSLTSTRSVRRPPCARAPDNSPYSTGIDAPGDLEAPPGSLGSDDGVRLWSTALR